jgi:hypothetical protein
MTSSIGGVYKDVFNLTKENYYEYRTIQFDEVPV